MSSAATETRIRVESPGEKQLAELKVFSWSIWTKEPSQFDWHYDSEEVCYFLEGDVTVKTDLGEVKIGKGDLVTFPQGLSCSWNVHKAVKKHYLFR